MSFLEEKLLITAGKNKDFEMSRTAVAAIDSKLCINCGICRRSCPTEAIAEYQRAICRYCPDCANGPEMFYDETIEYASLHSCSIACPLGTIPEGYVNKIAEGKFDDAYDLISELNPLPGICGRICNHPCMDDCKRGLLIDEPINIRGLKRFVTDRVSPRIKPFIPKYDLKVAIVGAGPAGITAAFDLSKKGYKVTIFEAGPEPGGMMNVGIPAFRLDKNVLKSEISALEEAGIEIIYNAKIGKNPTIDDLFNEKFAAVLLAIGATKGMIIPIEGSTADTVYDAVSLMRRINKDIPQTRTGSNRVIEYGKVVVIGGGSVALDTARALLRKGATSATCVCVEKDTTMPAMPSEIEEANEEGVKFVTCSAPVRIKTEWTTVKGVEFKKVSEIKCDINGRIKPITIEGTEFTLDADTVVFATGQKPDLDMFIKNTELELNKTGLLNYDSETFMTSKDGVFVAGDMITGKGSVIDAMASGRRAASAIDNMLQGRKLNQRVEHTLTTADSREKIFPAMLEKLDPQIMPKNKDRDSFNEVELGYDERQAIHEARRCMKCGFEVVNEERCIGCGICVGLCPQNAISLVNLTLKEGN